MCQMFLLCVSLPVLWGFVCQLVITKHEGSYLIRSSIIFRLWDIHRKECIRTAELINPTSIELSRDRKYITVCHGSNITVLDSTR